MFSKKPPPEPKLPSVPPVLRFLGSGRLESISQQDSNNRIAHNVLVQAFREGAEQITLTPEANGLIVRYLIADEWQHTMTIPSEIAPGIAAAFKTLAGLPIWEHRMALEGLIVVRYGAADYDVSLAITPARYGEKITLRTTTYEQNDTDNAP